MEDLSAIVYSFGITTPIKHCERITTGHINDTYKIYSDEGIFILQKINTDVFRNPQNVMHNIEYAQRLIKQGLQADGKYDSRKFPEYLRAEKRNYLLNNGFWRVYRYIESVSLPPDCHSVKAFGALLGEFHRYTKSADISELYTTIPGFHSIEKNISSVLHCGGLTAAQQSIFRSLLGFITGSEKLLSPPRLVHNDVKWANVLIDPQTLLPETLIDYDTVMAGYAAFDFGDAVRSACVTRSFEPDYELLESFAEGYFSEYNELGAEEAAFGIIAVAAELSARFLYDILSGDNYFAGLAESEKMEKYRRNLRLAENSFNMRDEITNIISKAKVSPQH